jgi:hypothetical protein
MLTETKENIEVFTLVWIHEEERYYYFTSEFDESQFPNGYVDYYVTVENGVITDDTLNPARIGKRFNDEYDRSLWLAKK